jgi:nucleoside-diphosphate-sugar epimerase
MPLHIGSESELDDALSAPGEADVEAMLGLAGDVMVLGAGGKMGPSLASLARRASDAAGRRRRVIAVSRFSSPEITDGLRRQGVETRQCDLMDVTSVEALPACENILFLAGRKFGSTDRPDYTWAINTLVPALVARRFAGSRIVAFSTGNVYPFVSPASGGSKEEDSPAPAGEYAQSCLGRERIFEYFSRERGAKIVLLRLNYAVDLRYGVLVDIARRVHEGQAVQLGVGHFNAIWQADANSYALRSLALCQSPPRVLNVTGSEIISVREAALFFADRFGRHATFTGTESGEALLSNAARCHALLGRPRVSAGQLMEAVTEWVRSGGRSLDKPTHFEVRDGRY